MIDEKHYAYRVLWAAEDGEYVATVAESRRCPGCPRTRRKLCVGHVDAVANVVKDLEASREPVPEPIAERRYSGKFNVRVPDLTNVEGSVR